MTTYIGWETSISLLLAYETLAMNHVKTLGVESGEGGTGEPHPYCMYKNAFALLILNASIVEGTMRTILSERVKVDLNAAIERGRQQGRTEHDAPTRLLAKFLVDLESSGSWQGLTSSAISYLGEKMDNGVDAEIRDGVEKLFVLRNVLAHGTTLIQPKVKMSDDMRDEYPFNWQAKLHGVAMYLDKRFSRGGVFDNLAHPDCAKHFMEVTQQYFVEIEKKFTPVPERAAKMIEMIKGYSFGYFNWHR
ncbi:hypothetical protein ACM7LX_06590 [Pseudomonas aeruginosa]|uniref:hypothetical protein n=1 Tax=Pseudomonas aeruginosa TaxID=287 RepID=UPI0015576F39|nr:hypothetical protein [Pseudomonas aeruginosa]QKF01553.1 hypothetical protein HPT09_09150 [Pseudomonas aeruginosa]HCF1525312.1 hypothetical protein [Pseudomonas aeruginosa]